jgi:hypothetical protein
MAKFATLTYSHVSGRDEWDLCPECWKDFNTFLVVK